MKKIAALAIVLMVVAFQAFAVCFLDITTEGIVPFQVNTFDTRTVEACCGTPAYSFSLHSGSLPAGLSLNSSGVISGTPTTVGYQTPCIKVTDAAACHVTRCFEIYVLE